MDETNAGDVTRLSETYVRFAWHVRGRSPLYEVISKALSEDEEVLERLVTLAPPKRQPNLLFGTVRFLFGVVDGWATFRELVTTRWDAVSAVIRARTTQTNEPARCATLLPILASLPQPLALLEIGTSAGLCLLPDRYAYEYGDRRIEPRRNASSLPARDPAPVFRCEVEPATRIPERNVHVVWRAGLDIAPVDLGDDDALAWLEALVWPGIEGRVERFRAALAIARANPPRVVRGDFRTDLAALAREAPRDATLVVYHTAALVYLPELEERLAVARTVRDLGAVWLSNEDPEVFPHLAARAGPAPARSMNLVSLDDRPVAWADFHGARLEWIDRT